MSLVFIGMAFALGTGLNSSFQEERTFADETERSILLMFYNTENLFDFTDDSGNDDSEFSLGGSRGWNYQKYSRKLNAIAKVILSAGDWEPPAMVGLCETEKAEVVTDLLRITPLSKYDYDIVYTESGDERGIDVGLIYRKDIIDIVSYRPLVPESVVDGFASRPVLYVKTLVAGFPMHLFLNHWPSRRGGVLSGRDIRESLAGLVQCVCDSIIEIDGAETAIVVAGDFNCNPSDREMAILGGESLINLSSGLTSGTGTYRYRGVWQMFDQVLVSAALIDGRSYLSVTDFMIHSPGFLMCDDPVYPGRKPYSTYDGYRYTGGYSDHLPIKLVIRY